jgi:hypothetical protein
LRPIQDAEFLFSKFNAVQKVDMMVNEMQKVLSKAQQFESVTVELIKSTEAQVSSQPSRITGVT